VIVRVAAGFAVAAVLALGVAVGMRGQEPEPAPAVPVSAWCAQIEQAPR
jgi:hypothetical protein